MAQRPALAGRWKFLDAQHDSVSECENLLLEEQTNVDDEETRGALSLDDKVADHVDALPDDDDDDDDDACERRAGEDDAAYIARLKAERAALRRELAARPPKNQRRA